MATYGQTEQQFHYYQQLVYTPDSCFEYPIGAFIDDTSGVITGETIAVDTDIGNGNGGDSDCDDSDNDFTRTRKTSMLEIKITLKGQMSHMGFGELERILSFSCI